MSKTWGEMSERERDALVAERVMGWVDFWPDGTTDMAYPPNEQVMGIEAERAPIPHYSTDIAAAWQVAEKLDHDYYDVHIQNTPGLGDEWCVKLTGLEHSVCANTLPEAICLAALKAHGIEV